MKGNEKEIKGFWKKKISSLLIGFFTYVVLIVVWIMGKHGWVKWYLKTKLGISIMWIIITLISAWTLAGILHNASRL